MKAFVVLKLKMESFNLVAFFSAAGFLLLFSFSTLLDIRCLVNVDVKSSCSCSGYLAQSSKHLLA